MTGRRRSVLWRGGVAAILGLSFATAPTILASDRGEVVGRVRVSPIVVSLALSAPTATTGQSVKAQATVSNVGDTTIRGIVVELRVDPDGLLVSKGPISVGQLKGGRSATASWALCGVLPGNYVVLARATFNGISVHSDAVLLRVTAGGRKTCA